MATLTINFNANGGTGSMPSSSYSNTSDTIAKNSFLKTSYSFNGWKTLSNNNYTDEDEISTFITNGDWDGTTDVTLDLYAQWNFVATEGYSNSQYYKNIANAIRLKNGSNSTYTPIQMVDAITALNSDATLNNAGYLLTGYSAYAGNTKYTGTMANRGNVTFTPSTTTQTGESGFYSSVTVNALGNADTTKF